MKYILLTISLLAMSAFRQEYVEAFDEKVAEAYDDYGLLGEYDGVNYAIKVYYGVFDDKVYYGICFYNETPKQYKLRIVIGDKVYRLKANSRNDVAVVAMPLKGGAFSLAVYDKNGQRQSLGTTVFTDIEVISKEEFYDLPGLLKGSGNGVKIDKPLPLTAIGISPLGIIAIAAGIILLVCGIVIYVFYRKRKGIFSEAERKKNVFNFKEFILSVEKSLQEREDANADEYIPAEAEIMDEDKKTGEETTADTYVPHYSWARDEEERSGFNIKKHLQELGFVTDYRIVSTEEKNKIMLELMRLKEQKVITSDDYLDEVSELWKKRE